jgi:hypothetical protein
MGCVCRRREHETKGWYNQDEEKRDTRRSRQIRRKKRRRKQLHWIPRENTLSVQEPLSGGPHFSSSSFFSRHPCLLLQPFSLLPREFFWDTVIERLIRIAMGSISACIGCACRWWCTRECHRGCQLDELLFCPTRSSLRGRGRRRRRSRRRRSSLGLAPGSSSSPRCDHLRVSPGALLHLASCAGWFIEDKDEAVGESSSNWLMPK